MFAWCATGGHVGIDLEFQTPCKGSYRRLIKDKKKRGRKVIETILVDEMVYCDCPCHAGRPVKNTTRKSTKSRRKK